MSDWVLSVYQLCEYVRKQLAADPILSRVRVRGEISGFKRHYSGHLYFSIKDEQARVQCVMFRQSAMALGFEPKDGMRVVVSGSASLYPASGNFQIYCESMEREGAGALHEQFEALKARLSLEGLFDPARKRSLPMLPKCVGIVTSRSGAALRDMVRVINRRYPGMNIVLAPALAQGEGAAKEIAEALDRLNELGGVDVILCGRGGGSIEDLWAFNEEVVARAIARSRMPVVSCVGHETDFTIADFVADVRAATPSVAAELAVPVYDQLVEDLNDLSARLVRAGRAPIVLLRARLAAIASAHVLKNPRAAMIDARRAALVTLDTRQDAAMRTCVAGRRAQLSERSRALRALNPDAVLGRGYARLVGASGHVTRMNQLALGDTIQIKMCDGCAVATVDALKEDNHGG